jgi:acyl carrier protein
VSDRVRTQVEDTLADLVARYFDLPREAVDLDLPMADAPDSLKLSELIVALEQRFDVALDDGAIAQARLVRDLAALVEARLRASGRG